MLLNRREMITTSALLATGILVGCGPKPETVLRLGTLPWRAFEPLFFAREQGYFAATLQIVEYAGTPDIHRSFQNQAIEAATVTLDEALRLAQFQPDLRVIMAFALSNGADALLCKPEITTLAELQGKRVGVELNATGSFLFSRILDLAGLYRTDVTIVPLNTATTEAAFLNGSVDAVIAYEPFSSRLQAAGAKILFDSTQIPGEIVDVLIVRRRTLQDQERALIDLVNGWVRAINVLQTHEPALGDDHLISEEFSRSRRRMELLDHGRNIVLLGPSEAGLSGTVRKLGASMKKYELLNEMIDPAILLDSTILKQATP